MGQMFAQQYSRDRCFRVYLKGEPLLLYVELLVQFLDKTLADIAEGSYIIGVNLHADGHCPVSLSVIFIHLPF